MPDSKEGLAGRPEAENLLNIYAALADKSQEAAIAEFSRRGSTRPKPLASSPEAVADLEGSVAPRAESREPRPKTGHIADALSSIVDLGDAPSCHVCGSIMVRNGSCYKCMSCGSTSGCS